MAASLIAKAEEAQLLEHPGRATLLVLVQLLAMAVVLFLALVLLIYFVRGCVALLVCLVRALVVCLQICVVAPRELIRAFVVGVWECAGGAWKMVMACCRGSVPQSKMMKAPGKPGVSIPRDPFQANPKAYFNGLRANRGARS